MATINNYMKSSLNSMNTSMYTSLFGNSNDSTANFLSDYASVKNGSYGKLLKAYYTKGESSSGFPGASFLPDTKNTGMADSAQKLSRIQTVSSDLSKSSQALLNDSLWEKKETRSEDGTLRSDYDWDAITKAVSSFVKDYNQMLTTAVDSDTKGVLRNAYNMTEITRVNQRLLAEAGINIGEGNKLEVDTSKLKTAKMSTLKSLFQDSYSYVGSISQKVANINSAAGGKSLYTQNAKYSTTVASAIATTVDSEV